MNTVDPRTVVSGCDEILDNDGEWPNFHDSEIIDLQFSRGDVRPDDGVYIFPRIVARVELCAIQFPFTVNFVFEDCSEITLSGFNHQNPIMDLHFGIEPRGTLNNGEPMTPYIVIDFTTAWEFGLTFKCFRASVSRAAG